MPHNPAQFAGNSLGTVYDCANTAQICTVHPPEFHTAKPPMATPIKTAQGTWRIQIEVRGQRDGFTAPTKREATEWAARRSVEMRTVASGQVGTTKTLRDALRQYARDVTPSKRGWQREVIRLAAFERQALPLNKKMTDITAADISAWRDARLAVNARGSVLRDMTLLSAVLGVARRDWGWLSSNPMADVRRPAEPDHRERIIAGAEVRGILRALRWGRGPVRSVSCAVANCFLLALQTGMRAGELCGLEWGDVRADFVILHAGKTKTGKGRNVPLTPTARRTIELMRGWDDVLVFGLKSQTLDAMFRKYRGKAGLEGFTFHDSRHTAATRLAGRLHLLDLCRMFGWRNTSQALTYYNATASEIAARLK